MSPLYFSLYFFLREGRVGEDIASSRLFLIKRNKAKFLKISLFFDKNLGIWYVL